MRKNFPVNNHEYLLAPSCALISHTDAKGIITHVNDEFAEASGFAREELIGQPHNMIRHPDMPPAAFSDLWATLKKGQPWRGMVKNRRKNGDYYWVQAQVTPRTGGGYISVRIAPQREQVAEAEELYAAMRAGAPSPLSGGELVPQGLPARLRWRAARLSISAKLLLLGLLAAAGMLSVAALAAVYSYDQVMAERRGRTERLVEVAHGMAEHWKARAARGELPQVQAQAQALAGLRALRYGGNDYFWVQDMGHPYPKMLMHPLDPALEGKVLDAQKYDSAEGAQAAGTAPAAFAQPANLFVTAATLAREAGAGFIAYRWQKPGAPEGETYAKVSYVKRVAGWDWVVGSGIYVDDVRSAVLAGAARGGAAGLAITLCIFAFALWQRRSIRASLQKACAMADAIAQGNLIAALPVVDDGDLGELIMRLRIMRNNLHEVAASLRQNSATLRAAAGEISRDAGEGARSSSSQSEAVSSIAAAVEELSVSIDQVDEHARTALSVNQAASAQTTEGAQVIAEAIGEINDIARAVNASEHSIAALEGYSDQIAAIVGVIREIADQTNLLALNAAIEAARAGEQGRGFSVVAEEVRKLAERTAQSTGEISAMVAKVIDGTRTAAREMEQSVARANRGVALASRADGSMSAIHEGMAQSRQAVDGITVSLSEQSVAAREMAARVEQLAQGAEAHTFAAQRTADEAVRMSRLAAEMEKLSARFRISHGG